MLKDLWGEDAIAWWRDSDVPQFRGSVMDGVGKVSVRILRDDDDDDEVDNK